MLDLIVSHILPKLANINLTASQLLGSLIATIVGGLIIALRLEGSELHKTQIKLLSLQLSQTQQAQDARVEAARAAFGEAYEAYKRASK